MYKILAVLFFFGSLTAQAITTKNIHEALAEGLVKIQAKSTGNMNGKAVNLEVQVIKGGVLKIVIPGGSVFHTIDDGMQDMLVVEEQELLATREKKVNEINGYCCQASNAVPSLDSDFKVGVHPSKGITQLVAFLPQKNISKDLVQDAIWNICDGELPTSLFEENNKDVDELRKLVCSINGVDEPWYEKKRRIEMDENRQVLRLPVSVEAKLSYRVEKPGGKLSYQVIDAAGSVLRTYQSKSTFPQKGNYNMGFKLTVSGWETGQYTLVLYMDGEVLKEYPFEV